MCLFSLLVVTLLFFRLFIVLRITRNLSLSITCPLFILVFFSFVVVIFVAFFDFLNLVYGPPEKLLLRSTDLNLYNWIVFAHSNIIYEKKENNRAKVTNQPTKRNVKERQHNELASTRNTVCTEKKTRRRKTAKQTNKNITHQCWINGKKCGISKGPDAI